MQKKIIGTCALFGAVCASPAIAQNNVSIYGIVDSGVVYTTNANNAGDSIVKMPTVAGSLPSRIGFRAIEDLGDGMAAIINLESGFGPDTGMLGQGNRLFGRLAFVGLKTNFGTVTLGRINNMSYLATAKSDILGPNLFGNLDPYLPNARSDNAIGYMGTFNNFTVGATYSFGRDVSSAGGPAGTGCPGEVAGNSKACRQYTALLGYDNQRYGVTVSYDRLYGNTGADGFLTTSDSYDQRTTLSGYVDIGGVRIGTGVIERKRRAAAAENNLESDQYYLGATYPLADALILQGEVGRLDIKNSVSDSTVTVVRLIYSLSKSTALHGSIGHMANSGQAAMPLDAGGTVGVGKSQNGIVLGLRHMF
jgi:predicted porin